MPTLTDHKSRRIQRILLVGDPGVGKTSCYGYLLEHGQKLFVADFDDGLAPIIKLVKPEFHKNLVYETLIDKVRPDLDTGYPRTIGKPTAWRRFIKLVDKWVDLDGTDYGKPEDWPDNQWLITDNLTSMGRAALFFAQDFKGKMGQRVSLPTLGDAINRVEGVPQMLQSFPINTITVAHLGPVNVEEYEDDDSSSAKLQAPEEKMTAAAISRKLFPVTLGRKLPRRIGMYFTTILQVAIVGSGERAKRVIRTVPSEEVDVKLPIVPKSLPIEVPITDLHKIIELLKSEAVNNNT